MVWCNKHRAAYPAGHVCFAPKPHRPHDDEPRDKWGRTSADRRREYQRRKATGHYSTTAYKESQRRRVRPSKAKYPPQFCILCGERIVKGPGNSTSKKARFCTTHRKPWYFMFRYWAVDRAKQKGVKALSVEEAERMVIKRYNDTLPDMPADIVHKQGTLNLYKIPFKIEGHKIKKPFYCFAHNWGEAYAIAARRIPHWIEARGWQPGTLTKELLQ